MKRNAMKAKDTLKKTVHYVATVLAFLPFFTTACTDLIERIQVRKNRLDVIINKEFKKNYLREDFFIEYDEDIDLEKLDYSIVIMPFIMNVISLVWISGEDYYVESMDQEVYDSLERIKQVFKVFYPKTSWTGRLIPKKLVTNKGPVESEMSSMTALLFSGGLDSTSSSLAHRNKQQLLITSWGQSGLPLDHPEFWYKIKNRIVAFAERYGHKNAFIKSNYYYFLNLKKLKQLSPEIVTWRIDTIEDIGWAGLTAPILVTHGIRVLRIASSDCLASSSYPSAANPYIDGNIRFAGITIKHDQFELSRFQKVLCIAYLRKHHLIGKQELIICQKRGGIINCCSCEKCLLTIISLMAAGENPKEYGFTHFGADVEKNTRTLLQEGKLSASGIWQFVDIQKKLPQVESQRYDLEWFTGLDFSHIRPYDAKKGTSTVDWPLLQKMFPDIKVHKNKNSLTLHACADLEATL